MSGFEAVLKGVPRVCFDPHYAGDTETRTLKVLYVLLMGRIFYEEMRVFLVPVSVLV